MLSMESKREDTITIHLGKVLSEQEYKAVVDALIAFLNKRFPNQNYNIAS